MVGSVSSWVLVDIRLSRGCFSHSFLSCWESGCVFYVVCQFSSCKGVSEFNVVSGSFKESESSAMYFEFCSDVFTYYFLLLGLLFLFSFSFNLSWDLFAYVFGGYVFGLLSSFEVRLIRCF